MKAFIGVAVAGALIAVIGAVRFFAPFVDTVVSPAQIRTPGELTLELTPGEYYVYELTGSRRGGGGISFTERGPTTLRPEEVTVTGATGRVTTTDARDVTETIDRNNAVYTGAVRFEIEETARYTIAVNRDTPGSALISRSLGDTFGRNWRWLVMAVTGALVGVAGLVGVIVAVVRRRRRESGARPAGPPPGWYADPSGARRWRFWDGERWTDDFSQWPGDQGPPTT